MPGGHEAAWPLVRPLMQSISAKVGPDPCCQWVGPGGAGHYVKMVHNGIEYGDMQLICEAYHLMRDHLKMTHKEMAEVFAEWNKGELDSFLIEITADILAFEEPEGTPLVERIRDAAGQKGTGKWTAISALEHGTPVTLIASSVFSRCLSALKEERVAAAPLLPAPSSPPFQGDRKAFLEQLRQALYASKIVSYAQGFMLLREAAKQYGWSLDYGAIALMWRGGCIIRSRFLGEIKAAFEAQPSLPSLLLAPFFLSAVGRCGAGWRAVLGAAVASGTPAPAMAAALSFYDGYRCANLPANLLQAQRDYFGAHTYELTDQPGSPRHTDWTGRGGRVASSTYQA